MARWLGGLALNKAKKVPRDGDSTRLSCGFLGSWRRLEEDQDRFRCVRRPVMAPAKQLGRLSQCKIGGVFDRGIALSCFLIAAIIRILITALALCAESLVLKGRSNNRMAAMIKSHPGLKPLEEVDSEMAELIAQEQRRQACAPRPRTAARPRGRPRRIETRSRRRVHAPPRRRAAVGRARRSRLASPHHTPSTRLSNTVHVHRAHRVGELRQ